MSKDWLAKTPIGALTTTRATQDKGRSLTEWRAEAMERFAWKATVLMLLDTSSSMGLEGKLLGAKGGVLEFAAKAHADGYRVGVVSFDTEAAMLCSPSQQVAEMTSLLDALKATGSTNLTAALKLAFTHLGTPGTRAAVVATDGMPDDPEGALAVAKEMKNAGIRIITIGTPDANEAFLRKLASASDLASVVRNADLPRAIAASAARLLLPSSNPRR